MAVNEQFEPASMLTTDAVMCRLSHCRNVLLGRAYDIRELFTVFCYGSIQ